MIWILRSTMANHPCKDAICSDISIDELLLILFSMCPASLSEHWVWAYPNGVQVRELCGESVQVIDAQCKANTRW